MSYRQLVHRTVVQEQQRRIRALGTRQPSRPIRRPSTPRREADPRK